jgi:putative transcriptional regulator
MAEQDVGRRHEATLAPVQYQDTGLGVCHDWEMIDGYAGKLLIATPQLVDPNFYRTVILMLQHDEEGASGIVLNRPTEERVESHLPEWAGRMADPGVVHYGGPVDPDIAIGVALVADGMPTGVPGLSLVDLAESPGEGDAPVRVYSGYSGWGLEQLEGEIAVGSWYVVQASPDDPFDDPNAQWQKVLRRQSGFLSLVSTYPDDIRQN